VTLTPTYPAARVLRTAGYTAVAAGGFGTLLYTPQTIESVLGESVTTLWSVLLIVGGVAAALGSVSQRWDLEYPGLPFVLAGMGIYLVALWSITADDTLSRSGQTLLLTAFAFMLAARLVDLRALARSRRKR
jgi:hypothetical protein